MNLKERAAKLKTDIPALIFALVEREYNGRMYQSVTYNKNAQEYIVGLIKKLVKE